MASKYKSVIIKLDWDSFDRFYRLIKADTNNIKRRKEKNIKEAKLAGKNPRQSNIKPVEFNVVSMEQNNSMIIDNSPKLTKFNEVEHDSDSDSDLSE